MRCWSDDLVADFYGINAQWVETMFVLEKKNSKIPSPTRKPITG